MDRNKNKPQMLYVTGLKNLHLILISYSLKDNEAAKIATALKILFCSIEIEYPNRKLISNLDVNRNLSSFTFKFGIVIRFKFGIVQLRIFLSSDSIRLLSFLRSKNKGHVLLLLVSSAG